MFCAIATTIDRCKTEGVVDVFQVVKALRIHKPGAVPHVVSYCYISYSLYIANKLPIPLVIQNQYMLIHEAVLVYLESFDTYANFRNVV